MKSTSPSDVLRPVRPGLLAAALAVAALLPACTRSGAGAAGELVLSGNLEVDDAQLGFKTAGRVVARPVSEGDRVRAGLYWVRLDTPDGRRTARMVLTR